MPCYVRYHVRGAPLNAAVVNEEAMALVPCIMPLWPSADPLLRSSSVRESLVAGKREKPGPGAPGFPGI